MTFRRPAPLIAIAALACGAIGCAPAPPTSYSIVINGFTSDQTAEIVAGIDTWQKVVGDPSALQFYVSIGAPCDLGHEDAICITPTTTTKLGADAQGDVYGEAIRRTAGENALQDTVDPEGAIVLIATDVPGIKHTTEHEIGHALGLAHADHTVMAANIVDAAPDVTRADVVAFYAAR